MTDIEQKALALVNEVSDNKHTDARSIHEVYSAVALSTALCRAIEQHEAFRQEVSDALHVWYDGTYPPVLDRFIIPAPKPDPLVVVAESMGYYGDDAIDLAEAIRVAMDARGLGIREKNDD